MDTEDQWLAHEHPNHAYLGFTLAGLYAVHLGPFAMGGMEFQLVENFPIRGFVFARRITVDCSIVAVFKNSEKS